MLENVEFSNESYILTLYNMQIYYKMLLLMRKYKYC